VENKAGANGFIALQYLLGLQADGYTFTIGTNTTHAANSALFKKLPYDPVGDFVPLSGVTIGGVVLVVAPSTPANNVQELLALARKKKMTFGSGNSSSRAGGEVLRELAGVDLLHVPYKALPAALTDLVGGQIDMVFGDAPAVMPLVKAGKLKALGVTTAKRSEQLPEVPTLMEQGFKDLDIRGTFLFFAPAGIPPATFEWIHRELSRAVDSPEVRTALAEFGTDAKSMSAAETATLVRAEDRRWSALVKKLGITWE